MRVVTVVHRNQQAGQVAIVALRVAFRDVATVCGAFGKKAAVIHHHLFADAINRNNSLMRRIVRWKQTAHGVCLLLFRL